MLISSFLYGSWNSVVGRKVQLGADPGWTEAPCKTLDPNVKS